ncbi:hypothetical protein NEMBOFW57_004592 [Staphylotrichum longicolle]|uniref:Heterokaryon incompatibility domain-containing protein n=1 Tax=Staphylotrichum longicolle TaxID=669026 RepID=A0AAD4F9T1_9PEZI|nr:hypothetical protein NEMBOFW57_004592 [Staphylotrichum longicolle]
MSLCESCSAIRIQLLPDVVDSRKADDPPPSGILHSTTTQLLRRSETCPLCAIIRASFNRVGAFHRRATDVTRYLRDTPPSPVLLRAGRGDGQKTPNGGANIDSIEVLVDYVKDRMRGRFHLWADCGHPAISSGDIVERPLLCDGSSLKPSDLARKWLDTCTTEHAACRLDFRGLDVEAATSGSSALLKTHLIHIFNLDRQDGSNDPNSRLLRSRLIRPDSNFQAKYATLSHCWGPPEQRPRSTTQANLAQRLNEIPWGELPQTFRDAILLCADIGIRYLWIDSLCIVQDSATDVQTQMAVMGEIYAEACLNIAASSAHDSSQGLFGVRGPLVTADMPYHHPTLDGDTSETNTPVSAYIEPELDANLNSAPLSSRGWVLQESFLSRRVLHFTKDGLLWTCQNTDRPSLRHRTSEFGGSRTVLFQNEWQNLVVRYSRCALSYNSDKLHAIRGLETLFSERDGKPYSRGLCLASDASVADLLWFGEERLVRDVEGVESWSWASTTGPISFKSAVFDESTTPNATCREEADGRLCIDGHAKEVGDMRGPLSCQAFCYEDLQDMDFSGRIHDDYRAGSIQVAPTFLLLAEGGARVGWGVFDEHERPMERVWCLALLHQRVWEGFGNSKEQWFVWCLLLQECDEDGNDWKRVGWAIVLEPGWIGVSDPAKPNFRHLILL